MNKPLRRRGRPNDLKGSTSGYLAPRPGAVHDRKAADLLINAKVAAVEVEDPFAVNFGDKIVVLRSTRNDPLADMRSRDMIDECDYQAGRHWQNAHENSQIGSIRAIDPSKEAVDGGRPPEMLTDKQRRGASDVNAAREALGPVGNALITDVLADGLSIKAAARKRGMVSDRDRLFLSRRFRECLGTLAVLFGLAMKRGR
jgi:hypothetical protein